MFMQNEIVGTAAPTFHLKEIRIDPAKCRAELETVVALANAGRRGIKKLGEFSVSLAREDDDHSYFTQIRAVPSSGFGGCEFRYDMPARNTGNRDLESTAKQLLASARAFARLEGLDEVADQVRAFAARVTEPATTGTVPMRVVAFGMTVGTNGSHIGFVLDVEALGDDLRPGMIRVHAHEEHGLQEKLEKVVRRHVALQAKRDLAFASRALGWIDETAVAILDASGMTRQQAFALLRESRQFEFYFGGEEGCDNGASLFWEDGVVYGSLDPVDNRSAICGNRLTILRPPIPDTLLTAWAGRRFGDVASHDYIPADALVTRVENTGDWVYIDFVAPMRQIDEGLAVVRAEPRAD